MKTSIIIKMEHYKKIQAIQWFACIQICDENWIKVNDYQVVYVLLTKYNI